jgi:hypothetical protein
VSDQSRPEAAAEIAAILASVPSRERGRVLRSALDALDPARARPQRPTENECAWCGKPFVRHSWNQRYCSYFCSRDCALQRRLEVAAIHFEEVSKGRQKRGE